MWVILVLLLDVPLSQCAHFLPVEGGSPVHVCRLLSSLGRGQIYAGALNSTNCVASSEDLLVIKCDKEVSLEEEYIRTKSISPIGDFVYEKVVSPVRPDRICFTMEYFGPSLASLRDKVPGKIWPWEAIAILGMRLISQVASIHASGYAHTDLHFLNVVATNRSVTDFDGFMMQDPMVIDFGDAVRLADRHDAPILIQNDVMAVLVGLRYLVAGEYRYYTEKKYGFNPKTAWDKVAGGICIDTPPSYCEILTYIYSMKTSQTPDYGFVISTLSKY